MPLIALIGLPGSGKSTIGRHLARRLDIGFVDADVEIETRIKETIRAFFEREGEETFRDLEESTLDDLSGRMRHGVLATGGGAVLRAANRLALQQRATVIYLRSKPKDIARRLRHDVRRPLLQVADPLERLQTLFAVRDPLYLETAHYVVEINRPTLTSLLNTIVMQLELAGIVDPGTVPSPVDAPTMSGH